MRYLGYLLCLVGIVTGADFIADIYVPHLEQRLLGILEHAVSCLLIFNSLVLFFCLWRLGKGKAVGKKPSNLGLGSGPLGSKLGGASTLDREWQKRRK